MTTINPIIKERVTHHLPRLIADQLWPLCESLDQTEMVDLLASIHAHADTLRAAKQAINYVDSAAAEKISIVLTALFDAKLGDDIQPLIVGAARYFLQDDDAVPDISSAHGLDDDTQVLNAVTYALGREDLQID